MRRNRAPGVIACITTIVGLSPACNQSPSLATQVAGWWVDPQSGACYCPQQAECGGGDCVAYALFGLLPNNRYVEGSIAYSANLASMSTMGTLLTGTYQVRDTSVIISQPNVADATLTVTFLPSGEAHFGARTEVRPPAAITAALEKATASGSLTWKSYPVTQ